jgi:hypothetical protein
MSMTMSVAFVTNRSIAPPVPAGTIAAFAVTVPVRAFSVETRGCACPTGHTLRYPSEPWGIAVKFSEYACALGGMPQELDSTGNERV